MRLSVWVAAAALLATAGSALRPNQDEGTITPRRRSSTELRSRNYASSSESTEVDTTSRRMRGFKRREQNPPREAPRTKKRSRLEATTVADVGDSRAQSEGNERFSSRKTYSRTRNRLTTTSEPITSKYDGSTPNRNYRTRQMFRMAPTPAMPELPTPKLDERQRHNFRKAPIPTTPRTLEATSPKIDESKIEVINSNLDDIPKMVFNDGATMFKRRSSVSTDLSSEKINRGRGRNNRLDSETKLEADLASSGTTNNIAVSEKEETTVKNTGDVRNSRKLRYRTRLAESDADLMGQGIMTSKYESSHNNDNITSQPDLQTSKSTVVDSTESSNPSTTSNAPKITRRPLGRSKVTFRPPSKAKLIDEISEDDNYPESFKALLQMKNVTIQTNSQPESLSVKASQKIYKTFLPTSSPRNINDTEQQKSSSQLRKKQSTESTTNSSKEEKTDIKPVEKKLYKRPEYKPRATFHSRTKKPGMTTSTDASNLENSSTQKPYYKFNRKFKITTTESPEKNNRGQNSFSPRYKSNRRGTPAEKKSTESTEFSNTEKNNSSVVKILSRHILPRTSYYSRYRKIETESENSTETSKSSLRQEDKPSEKALIYTPITSSGNDNTVETEVTESNKVPEDFFVIAVTSKESNEKSSENSLNMDQSSEGIDMSQFVPTTPKYHASYKNDNEPVLEVSKDIANKDLPIRNIQPKQHSRRRKPEDSKVIQDNEDIAKFTDLNAKTASTSFNGITPEPEKSKGRFSSKYRASLLDKPLYKATVPSVTPTTVEAEEIDLGPGMKAITITQTRRTLSSEDLRLSESVVKPSHVMNVEASQHSPSVTVSIFDALADILTSTPRPRLSTTTEVTPKTDIIIDVKQTLNGVSNNVNVNSVRGLANDDSLLSTSSDVVTANTKLVQTTDQTTPINVINRMSVGDRVTPSLDEETSSTTVNILPNNPILIPTTPVSARRPFAFKVLYSEPTTDMTTPSPNQSSTDNQTTVYNTQSDILLPDNKLVSSELTSMLTDNINDLLKNLDEKTRSRLTVDMEKILKSLIPRAVDGHISVSDDVDTGLNTTPYSLEDILDTEITMDSINNDNSTGALNQAVVSNILQTVGNNTDVNTESEIPVNTTEIAPSNSQNVKISDFLLDATTNAPVSDSNSLTMLKNESVTLPVTTISTVASAVSVMPTTVSSTLKDYLENDTIIVDSISSNTNAANQDALPIPFFTNSKISDFTLGEVGNINNFITDLPNTTSATTATISGNIPPLTPNPSVEDNIELVTQDPNTVSPLQLWVLNKKAQVLKMIEDLIKQHNAELGMPPPLTDNRPNLISARLSEIMNNMNMTTKSDVSNISDLISTLMTSTPITPDPSTTSSNIPTSSESITVDVGTTARKTSEVTFMFDKKSITSVATDPDTTTLGESKIDSTTPQMQSAAIATTEGSTNTRLLSTERPEFNFTIAVASDETTTISGEATTTPGSTETTTMTNIETIITLKTDVTQISSTETSSNVENTPWVPPKKDYVIFGILPNDTVVRKDPNQDVLESLTEASPYIVYGVLPNNTIIRKFPNGTRVPRVMQKIDILPISPWSLRNPYSPIHNNPAIVRPQSNPIRVSYNVTSTDTTNNETDRLTSDTVNNQQPMISSPKINLKDRSTMGFATTNRPPTEKSTASHVLSLRTSTTIPSIDVILLNSISSAAKEEKVILSMTSSTSEPRILTLDIDPETKQIRTEKPANENMNAVFKFIPIDQIMTTQQDSNVLKLSARTPTSEMKTDNAQTTLTVTEVNSEAPQIQTSESIDVTIDPTTYGQVSVGTQRSRILTEQPHMISSTTMLPTDGTTNPPTTTNMPALSTESTTTSTTEATTTTTEATTTTTEATTSITEATTTATEATTTTTTEMTSTTVRDVLDTAQVVSSTFTPSLVSVPHTTSFEQDMRKLQEDALLLQNLLGRSVKNFDKLGNNNQLLNQKLMTASSSSQQDTEKLLQALSLATGQTPPTLPSTILNQQEIITTTNPSTTTQVGTTKFPQFTTNISGATKFDQNMKKLQEDALLLQNLFGINARNINSARQNIQMGSTKTNTNQNAEKLLQALLLATGQDLTTLNIPTTNMNRQEKVITTTSSTTTQSIEEDLRRYEEDTKLLKALLQATGQNPTNFDLPTLNVFSAPTTTPMPITTTRPIKTTRKPVTTTPSIHDDLKKFQEDAKFLQALLQATGQNPSALNIPALSGVTSNVRKPDISSNPTTTLPRPVYIPDATTTMKPQPLTTAARALPTVTTTFQPRETTTSANVKISTTNPPFTSIRRRIPTTTEVTTRKSNRNINLSPRFAVTTETPSSSTFSPQEDLAFLKNLKNVLNTNNIEDPETALANRIIALAVEKSLNEIQATTKPDRDGKSIANGNNNFIPTTTERRTTTTRTTTTKLTTTLRPTTTLSTPSIEEDIKQFEEDAKLLQALLKATGQNPANFNIPTLATGVSNVRSSTIKPSFAANQDLNLLSNLLSSPSPLNDAFDPLTVKPLMRQPPKTTTVEPRQFGAKIAVKDDLKSVQEDKKLLQTLIKLQGAQESTTSRNKITITGQSPDEALNKLLQKTQSGGIMVSEATQAPMSLSTEFGKSQDALLAALLKEQGFGPTTASSLDEQIRLAALLNQVVVTPKTRRTTTPPPPPPPPRRPVLDGLAWLWQQWRETAPGPNVPRPNRRPSQPPAPSSATSTSNRVNWFGSGPFVGNAEAKPTANRIPLEPPSVVTQQAPGRGQLVSAAINVTRAFSQFLGAAIQGAAQTVQSVIRAGQRAASDVYTGGSG